MHGINVRYARMSTPMLMFQSLSGANCVRECAVSIAYVVLAAIVKMTTK